MTWQYTSAGPGAVALMGELVALTGALARTLALGFGVDAVAARDAARAALDEGLGDRRDHGHRAVAALGPAP